MPNARILSAPRAGVVELSGALVPFAEVGRAAAARMAGRAGVASMRYNLTLAYLSCGYGSRVAAPLDVGPPRARVLLGGWQG